MSQFSALFPSPAASTGEGTPTQPSMVAKLAGAPLVGSSSRLPTVGGASSTKLNLVNNSGLVVPEPSDEAQRLVALQLVIKCADVGHTGAELGVHKRWLAALEEEFFRQGDQERARGLAISPLFDRTKQGCSKSQTGFYQASIGGVGAMRVRLCPRLLPWCTARCGPLCVALHPDRHQH